MAWIQARVLIEGRLQGINFRYQAQRQAQKLGLVGFVRHLSDGRIEIEMQGEKEEVDKMLAWCQEEPHSSQIRSILFRYDEEPSRSYSEFSVR